ESIGGVFEVRAFGLVPGLGSHVSWEERLDGRLAAAVCSIQAVKGVALGEGFDLASTPGSGAHDEIFWSEERGFYRETNHAGGLEGGMTTGLPLIVQGALKPIPTLTKPLRATSRRCSAPRPWTPTGWSRSSWATASRRSSTAAARRRSARARRRCASSCWSAPARAT